MELNPILEFHLIFTFMLPIVIKHKYLKPTSNRGTKFQKFLVVLSNSGLESVLAIPELDQISEMSEIPRIKKTRLFSNKLGLLNETRISWAEWN